MKDDENMSGMRAQLTGNSEQTFDQSYDQRKVERYQEAFTSIYREHGPEDEPVYWNTDVDKARKSAKDKFKDDQRDASRLDPGVDLTSYKQPMPKHLRLEFQDLLEQVPLGSGLWMNVQKKKRMEWFKSLMIAVCGSCDKAGRLRELMISYYKGRTDERLRRWSGAEQHKRNLQQNFKTGRETLPTGPLTAILQVSLTKSVWINEGSVQTSNIS